MNQPQTDRIGQSRHHKRIEDHIDVHLIHDGKLSLRILMIVLIKVGLHYHIWDEEVVDAVEHDRAEVDSYECEPVFMLCDDLPIADGGGQKLLQYLYRCDYNERPNQQKEANADLPNAAMILIIS